MEAFDILYYFAMSLFAALFLLGYGVLCYLIGKGIAEKDDNINKADTNEHGTDNPRKTKKD